MQHHDSDAPAQPGHGVLIDDDPLPIRLSRGDHPVVVSLLPERTLRAFRERLDLGYVYVRFTDTRGGTDIGFPIDTRTLDLSQVDLENGSGTVRLSGALTLDDIDVRCIADIDVATLAGVGHLEVVRA